MAPGNCGLGGVVQVGLVRVGQPFPFWVRNQTQLRLKVSAAVPADLVRLVPGSEVTSLVEATAQPLQIPMNGQPADSPESHLFALVFLHATLDLLNAREDA